MSAYIEGKERSQVNSLTLHLKDLEKEYSKTKVIRRKEIIKIRAEVNEIESRKTTEENNWNKELVSWIYEEFSTEQLRKQSFGAKDMNRHLIKEDI